jgi:hypothetical protein
MPVEEIEKTETVEKKTTEKFVICDACGVNTEAEDEIYTFDGKTIDQKLYFCRDCLDQKNTEPMTDRMSYLGEAKEPQEIAIHGVVSLITVAILGFAAGGLIGIIVGLILFLVLMATGLLIARIVQ